ncbi:hypothetical protein M2436_002701 [Streptomyces sp. HB372]|nr:hypothetical protein [Streptomyces sp. HB372]
MARMKALSRSGEVIEYGLTARMMSFASSS